VYIPGRRGSLQVEMLAAARSNGLLPHVLAPDFAAIRAELAAGTPVLVLQDLGALGIRRWHFAVVVGYDPARDTVILRSGTRRRHLETRQQFLRTWEPGKRWAVVITRPDRVPATASGDDFIRALAAASLTLAPAAVENAHAAALARWPDDPLVLFASGNQAYGTGQTRVAITRYRELLARDPGHVAGRNNLANALLDAGCGTEALAEARQATALVSPGSGLEAAVRDTLARVGQANTTTGSVCSAE
jgi:hypothetical protein